MGSAAHVEAVLHLGWDPRRHGAPGWRFAQELRGFLGVIAREVSVEGQGSGVVRLSFPEGDWVIEVPMGGAAAHVRLPVAPDWSPGADEPAHHLEPADDAALPLLTLLGQVGAPSAWSLNNLVGLVSAVAPLASAVLVAPAPVVWSVEGPGQPLVAFPHRGCLSLGDGEPVLYVRGLPADDLPVPLVPAQLPAEVSRAVPGAEAKQVWDRFRASPAYGDTLGALIEVQGGLCAYCEQPIVYTRREAANFREMNRVLGEVGKRVELDSQIEHVIPKSTGLGHTLALDNLIACCNGGSRPELAGVADPSRFLPVPKSGQCCGQAKKDDPLAADPRAIPLSPPLLLFKLNGTVCANPPGCAAARLTVQQVNEAIDRLNLNCSRLVNARNSAWEALELMRDLFAGEDPGTDRVPKLLGHDTQGNLRRCWSLWRQELGSLAEAWIASEEGQRALRFTRSEASP